jgi:hypothetical protein
MTSAKDTGRRYPKRRRALLKDWRTANKIPETY